MSFSWGLTFLYMNRSSLLAALMPNISWILIWALFSWRSFSLIELLLQRLRRTDIEFFGDLELPWMNIFIFPILSSRFYLYSALFQKWIDFRSHRRSNVACDGLPEVVHRVHRYAGRSSLEIEERNETSLPLSCRFCT